MKRATVPVVIYKDGEREVVGEAVVDLENYGRSYLDIINYEINLNDAGLTLRKDR
jgi:hypothetical protein